MILEVFVDERGVFYVILILVASESKYWRIDGI